MPAISFVLLALAAVLTGWLFFRTASDAIVGVGIQRHWKPLGRVYSARVVGLADRGGVRVKSTSLVVEISFADGERRQFTSAKSGSLHMLSVGDQVRVLTNTEKIAGSSIDVFEIDSAFELWIKDVLWAFGILCVVVGVPLWTFRPVRFRR